VTFSPAVRIPLPDGRGLPLGPLPGVMAILNVTPDSFLDGERFPTPDAAIAEGVPGNAVSGLPPQDRLPDSLGAVAVATRCAASRPVPI